MSRAVRPCKVPIGLNIALRKLGIEPSAVSERVGVPLELSGERLPMEQYFAAWRAIRDLSGDPQVGLRLAQVADLAPTEPLILALISCRCVREAFSVLSTYKRMLGPESVYAESDQDQLVLYWGWPDGAPRPPQVLVDVEFAFVTEMCRRATGHADLSPLEVHLQTTELESPAGHSAFFRGQLHLGATINRLVYRRSDGEKLFATHNVAMLEALIPYLKANTPEDEDPLIGQVRKLLVHRIRGQRPTIESIGKELAMSARSLQRALQDRRTAFRDLLAEVRNQQAREHLKTKSLSVDEIAFLIGFDDSNSFSRAFRAWNGLTPGEFRNQAA